MYNVRDILMLPNRSQRRLLMYSVDTHRSVETSNPRAVNFYVATVPHMLRTTNLMAGIKPVAFGHTRDRAIRYLKEVVATMMDRSVNEHAFINIRHYDTWICVRCINRPIFLSMESAMEHSVQEHEVIYFTGAEQQVNWIRI